MTTHTITHTTSLRAAVVAASAVLAVATFTGCNNQLVASIGAGPPVASVTCPDRVEVGAAFDVDGSASHDVDGDLATVMLRLEPGGEQRAELKSSFTVDVATVATVRLVVTDADGNSAEARCRIQVGDPAIDAVLPEEPVDPIEPTEPGEAPRVPGEPVDLTGTFALVAWDMPELGGLGLEPARQCATAPTVSLVQLVQTGRGVTMSAKTCSITLPTVNLMFVGAQRTTAPDRFVDLLPPLEASFELAHGEVGDTFAPFPQGGVQTVGSTVGATDDLPTDPNDTRATDDDGDGEKGVRIESSSGAQQIAWRRFVDGFEGVVVSNDVIDGSAPGSWQATAESSLLSFSFFDFMVPGGTGMPSTFQMTRTTDASCADVRAHLADIIAAATPPTLPVDCPAF